MQQISEGDMPPGIYFDMPEAVYHSVQALSCSGIKQLSVSPLHYWHCNLNPERKPSEETYPQRIGRALHCRLLESARFRERYAVGLDRDDLPGLLETMDDMKEWLTRHGLPATAKRKQELIDRILDSGHPATIWEVEQERFNSQHAGKVVLDKFEAALLEKAARVVDADPYAKAALTGGMPEVSFFVPHPATGILLKARMDYVKPEATVDLKSFSNSRGKPTDRAVFDALYYESYYLQTVFYHRLRELARRLLAEGKIATYGNVSEAWLKGFLETESHGFGFVFIESAEPFDLRNVLLRCAEAAGGGANVYWSDADLRIDDAIATFDECRRKFGDGPWREPQPPHVLEDADIPQLLFRGGAL